MQVGFRLVGAVVIGLLSFSATHSDAVILYSNLVPQAQLSGDQSVNGTSGAIFDDVLVDNLTVNTSNQNYAVIQSITVGILRNVGAGGVTVTAYRGTTTTPGNVNDFPILDDPQSAFGSVVLAPYAALAKGVEYYTITPATPLVVPLNLTDQPTFSEFAIGLSFSNQSANGWALAQTNLPDTNLDGAWDSDLLSQTNSNYALDNNGNPIQTTFALEINGYVPEPAGAMGTLIFGGIAAISRRKRCEATL